MKAFFYFLLFLSLHSCKTQTSSSITLIFDWIETINKNPLIFEELKTPEKPFFLIAETSNNILGDETSTTIVPFITNKKQGYLLVNQTQESNLFCQLYHYSDMKLNEYNLDLSIEDFYIDALPESLLAIPILLKYNKENNSIKAFINEWDYQDLEYFEQDYSISYIWKNNNFKQIKTELEDY